jgi:hypothetical protein
MLGPLGSMASHGYDYGYGYGGPGYWGPGHCWRGYYGHVHCNWDPLHIAARQSLAIDLKPFHAPDQRRIAEPPKRPTTQKSADPVGPAQSNRGLPREDAGRCSFLAEQLCQRLINRLGPRSQ